MTGTSRWGVFALIIASHMSAPRVSAQWQSNTGPTGATLGAIVGGDVERYVRALALAGIIKPLPWAVRPFGPDDLAAFIRDSTIAAHPWQGAMRRTLAPHSTLGAMLFTSANSGFPWGANDGTMWQGRGFTSAAGGAAAVRWGPFSAVAAPVAFRAQNSSFRLMPQVAFGVSPYADPLFPTVVDAPQRMGAGTYARLDGGESTVSAHGAGMAAGFSTASIGWGTGESFPAILGANAGGFPHLFAGTRGGGARLRFLGRITAQYVLGVLSQTAWSPVQGSETFLNARQSGTRRVGTGLTVSFMPQLLPSLELGASRFYHSPYRGGSVRWDAWSKPFEGLFKKGFEGRSGGTGDPTGDIDNQMASFFARWVFPARGAEATVEVFRDDHNWDSRDFAQEPENNSAVMASIRAITARRGDRLSLVTLEYFDGDVRPIAQARAQGFLYTHAGLSQGHTQRGQLLGTPIGAGAISGERVAWEEFTPTGSLRVNVQRWRTRALRTNNPEGLNLNVNYEYPNNHDWILDGSVAATRYRGARALTIEAGLAWAGVWQFDGANTNVYARASWSLF